MTFVKISGSEAGGEFGFMGLRIAVSGYTTPIGKLIVQQLVNRGHHLILVGRTEPEDKLGGDYVPVDFRVSANAISRALSDKHLDFFLHLALISERSLGHFFPEQNAAVTKALHRASEEHDFHFVLLSSLLAAFPGISEYAATRHAMELVLANGAATVLRLGVIEDPDLDPAIGEIVRIGRKIRVLPVPLGKVFATDVREMLSVLDSILSGANSFTHTCVSRSIELSELLRRVFSREDSRIVIVPIPKAFFVVPIRVMSVFVSLFGKKSRFSLASLNGIDIDISSCKISPLLGRFSS